MKKLFALVVLLLVGVTVLGPSQSQAFNSGTHIYIAERVFPFAFDKINLYYGSIAPDLSSYVAGDWPNPFCDTHYKFIKLPDGWWNLTQRAFAKGWQTHNEKWGADNYAHGTCQIYDNCVAFWNNVQENCSECCTYDGYVSTQAVKLANIPQFKEYLNKPPYYELAHFAIETAIDILLVRYHDPSLGLKLRSAAKYRSQEDLNLMVSTFATNEQIAIALGAAEYTFRGLIIDYGSALALPDPLRMIAISELGVQIAAQMEVYIDRADVLWILKVAMYLCQNSDYMDVIRAAIEGIRTNHELIR